MRGASRCAPGATAIPARARWRWASRGRNWRLFRDADRLSFEQFLHVIDGKTTGALRASLGLATTFADVYQYVEFARSFVDRKCL